MRGTLSTEGVQEVHFRCAEGAWKVYGRCTEGAQEVRGRCVLWCVGGVQKVCHR